MLLQVLVERASSDAELSLVVPAGSEHLIAFLGPLAQRVVSPSEAQGPVVRICAIGTSEVEGSLRAACDGLAEADFLVLAMRSAPDRLPVGILVDTLVDCGLWVVEAAPAPARGVGCALVVTRDETAPWRSYLLGDQIPGADRAVLRLLAEHVVEGLSLRAQGAELRGRDRARARELDRLNELNTDRETEVAELQQALADCTALVTANRLRQLVDLQQKKINDLTQELARAQLAARQGGTVRQAIRLVRQDLVHGGSRVLRSLWRRTRDHRDNRQGGADGGTSGDDDRSV